jgi:regulation of enolase protein 1 (concanavalin A-like superfamily)
MIRYRRFLWLLAGALFVTAGSMRPVAADLPEGWTAMDIGNTDPAGSTEVDASGVWTLMGSGSDIEGSADHFHFAFRRVKGDATITARFLSMVRGDYPWTKMGPMIRASEAEDAQNVLMKMTSGVGVRIQGRDDPYPNTHSNFLPALPLSQPQPVWLRLQRVGKEVSGYYSLDGTTWHWGGGTLTLSDLEEEALFGLAVTSHQNGTLATGKFDTVSLQPGATMVAGLQSCPGSGGVKLSWQSLPGADGYNVYRAVAGPTDPSAYTRLNQTLVLETRFSDTSSSLVSNQQYTYLVAPVFKGEGSQLVEGGRAAIAGSSYVRQAPPGFTVTSFNEDPSNQVDYAGGCLPPLGAYFDATTDTITLRAAGPDGIGGGADAFNFTSTEVEGDFSVTVKALTRPTRTSSQARAGLMIREALTAESRMADLVLTASQNGLIFEWRDTANTAANRADTPLVSAENLVPPIWLRLTRTGEKITAEYSLDGASWIGGTSPDNVATLSGLPAKVHVGLAITSASLSEGRQITEARFQGLTITKP